MRHSAVFIFVAGLLVSSCAHKVAGPPQLPCKSPEQLKEAVQYAVHARDTNFLWKLFFWGEASETSQRREKWAAMSILGFEEGTTTKISSFGLAPKAPNDDVPIRRKDGIVKRTLPTAGYVTCTGTHTVEHAEGKPTKIGFRNAPLSYGRDTNGNYWLTAAHVIPTNAVSSGSSR
jgi:hypothetical protein